MVHGYRSITLQFEDLVTAKPTHVPFTAFEYADLVNEYTVHGLERDAEYVASEDFSFVDGWIVYAPTVYSIRIGQIQVHNTLHWTVDTEAHLRPDSLGVVTPAWENVMHFPGRFHWGWIDHIYFHELTAKAAHG